MVIQLRRIRPEVDRKLRLHAQQVAPFVRPVISKLTALQQSVNEHGALVRTGVEYELTCVRSRGQRADGVQISTANKDRVRTRRRRFDAELIQPVRYQTINLVRKR